MTFVSSMTAKGTLPAMTLIAQSKRLSARSAIREVRRGRRIALVAYVRAEKRGFVPGCEL